jgi:hypothetical protein
MNSFLEPMKPAGILPSSKSQQSAAPLQPTPGALASEAPSLGVPPLPAPGMPPLPEPPADVLPSVVAAPAAELPAAPLPPLPLTPWLASPPAAPEAGGSLEHAKITLTAPHEPSQGHRLPMSVTIALQCPIAAAFATKPPASPNSRPPEPEIAPPVPSTLGLLSPQEARPPRRRSRPAGILLRAMHIKPLKLPTISLLLVETPWVLFGPVRPNFFSCDSSSRWASELPARSRQTRRLRRSDDLNGPAPLRHSPGENMSNNEKPAAEKSHELSEETLADVSGGAIALKRRRLSLEEDPDAGGETAGLKLSADPDEGGEFA